MASAAAQRYEIVFTGRVQGVGFRYTAADVARRFEVAGWVRNEADGSVRSVIEGDPAELDRFLAALQEAMSGYIRDVRVTRGAVTGEFAGFEIRR